MAGSRVYDSYKPHRKGQDIFTTGNIAHICGVAPRTVCKWFDSGKLKGHRIPDSLDRRVYLDDLIEFMTKHKLRIKGILLPVVGLVGVAMPGSDATSQWDEAIRSLSRETAFFSSALSAASGLARMPRVSGVIIDASVGRSAARELAAVVRGWGGKAVLLVGDDGGTEDGFDGVFAPPYPIKDIVEIMT